MWVLVLLVVSLDSDLVHGGFSLYLLWLLRAGPGTWNLDLEPGPGELLISSLGLFGGKPSRSGDVPLDKMRRMYSACVSR